MNNSGDIEASSSHQGDAVNGAIPASFAENNTINVDKGNREISDNDGNAIEADLRSELDENVKRVNDIKCTNSTISEIAVRDTNDDRNEKVDWDGVTVSEMTARHTNDDGGGIDQNTTESKETKPLDLNQSMVSTEKISFIEKESSEITTERPSVSSSQNDVECMHPDRQRIKMLLQHRKTILFRLRQCKKAAEERLIEYQKLEDEKQRNQSFKATKHTTNNQVKSNSADAPKLPLKANHQQNLSDVQLQKVFEKKIYNSCEEEINAYKELQSFASSFANRRQASSSSLVGGTGSGSSISLRTGSSVGNKMKAAVATLTSSSLRATSLSPFSGDISGGKEEQNDQGGKRGEGINNPTVIQNTAIKQSQTSITPMKPLSIEQSSSITMAKNMTIVGGGGELKPSVAPLTKQSSSKGKQLKKKLKRSRSSSKKLPSSNINSKFSSTTTTTESSANHVSMNLPLHHGINNNTAINYNNNASGSWNNTTNQLNMAQLSNQPNTSGVVSNYLHPESLAANSGRYGTTGRNIYGNIIRPQKVPQRILCPETDRLRKKRKQIESKLQDIFKKRYIRCLNPGLGNRKNSLKEWNTGFSIGSHLSSPTSTTFDISLQKLNPKNQIQSSTFQRPVSSAVPNENPYSRHISPNKDQLTPLQWKTYMSLGGYTPCLLPQRKKTQWDFVLEEMRWLATDFLEERKWKKACARTLSYCVSSHAPKFVASPNSSRRSASSLRNSTIVCNSSSRTNKMMSSSSEVNNEDSSNIKLVKIERDASVRENLKQVGDFDQNEDNSDEDCGRDEEKSNSEKRLYPEIKFEDPTECDMKATRSISQILKTIVIDNWNYARGDLNLSSEQIDPCVIFSRFYKLKSNMMQGKESEIKTNQMDLDNQIKHDTLNKAMDDKNQGENYKQSSIEDIMTAMEQYLSFAQNLRVETSLNYETYEKSLSNDLKETGLELHISQIKCLQYAEALWDDVTTHNLGASGFVVDGPVASGKTFSICALLWRRRNKGPQLLICSLESLVRWRHELKKFVGFNVFTFGEVGWSFDLASFNNSSGQYLYKSCDVLICASSNVTKLKNSISRYQNLSFVTVAIDARSASFPLLNRNEICDFDLESSKWWTDVIQYLVKNVTKTIIISSTSMIDSKGPGKNFTLSLQMKEQVELLSMKFAFIQHRLFHSNTALYGKRVFRWAKQHYIAMKKEGVLEESKSIFNNSIGGKGVLCKAMEVLTHVHEEVDADLPSVFPNWSIQLCPLTEHQRQTYERDCNFVRYSLSNSDDLFAGDKFSSFAKALLRLRRTCFHSSMHKALNPALQRSVENSNGRESPILNLEKSANSCSQPNVEIAKAMLTDSSKLQQLLNVLYKECGFSINENLVSSKTHSKSSRKRRKRKKVLILSCLPDILYVTSVFLNSAGISHELIMPYSTSDMDMDKQATPSFSMVLLLMQCQQAITRFESKSDSEAFDVLLSCPESLGSMSYGLSAANAEVIISLDEDWSSRSDFITYSILMKNCIQADSGGVRKFIKLIAEDTCEQTFLTFTKKVKGRSLIYPIPLFMSTIRKATIDGKGYLSVENEERLDEDAILGRNVMRYINASLNTVLCNDVSLPPIAAVGVEQRFLMDPGSFSAECFEPANRVFDDCLAYLGNNVSSLIDDSNSAISVIPESWRDKAVQVAKAMVEVESKAFLNNGTTLFENAKRFEDEDSLLTDLTRKYTARDTISKQVQRYVREFMEVSQLYRRDCVQRALPTVGRSGDNSLVKAERYKVTEHKMRHKTRSHLPSTRKSMGSCAEKVLGSLLMYSAYNNFKDTRDYKQIREEVNGSTIVPPGEPFNLKQEHNNPFKDENSKKRKNLFALSYSNNDCKLDGNQGCESIIYFPPLFPGLRPGKISQSKEDLPADLLDTIQSKKRKGRNFERNSGSKKLRTTKSVFLQDIVPNDTMSQIPIQQKDLSNDLNLIAASDADFIEQTNSLFDDDFLPDLTLDDKEGDVISEEVNANVESTIFQEHLDEDFGILGSGLFSSIDYSLSSLNKSSTWSNQYSFWLDPFEPALSSAKPFSRYCDIEEVSCQSQALRGPQLDSLIIRVKLQRMPNYDDVTPSVKAGYPSAPPTSFMSKMSLPLNRGISSTNSMRLSGADDSVSSVTFQVGTQHGQKKKKKTGEKKQSLSPIPGTLPQPSTSLNINTMHPKPTMPSIAQQILPTRNKDQFYASSIMPPTVHYARPYQLVQHNLLSLTALSAGRESSLHSDDFTPLLPMKVLCENEYTGDLSREISLFQRNQFLDSSQIKIMNFSPFSPGFLFEQERINDESISSRIGIKLPMGVKMPHRHRDFGNTLAIDEKWTVEQDTALKKSFSRYGSNWNIACQVITFNSIDVCLEMNGVRSARQCFERWKDLNQQEYDIHNHQKPDMSQGIIPDKLKSLEVENSLSVIVNTADLSDNKGLQIESSERHVKTRSRRLKRASSKRQNVPLTVPGYNVNNTTQPIQIHTSHPSHLQSVKSAVIAAGSNATKLEMWPLQFLDITENRRQNIMKRNESTCNSVKSPQKHASSHHQHTSQHVIHHSSAPNVPNSMQQQVSKPSTAARNPLIAPSSQVAQHSHPRPNRH